MREWKISIEQLAQLFKQRGIRSNERAYSLANYVHQELGKAHTEGDSELMNLRRIGERSLKESVKRHPHARIASEAMQKVWLREYSESPARRSNDGFIKGLYDRISRNWLSKDKTKKSLVYKQNIDATESEKKGSLKAKRSQLEADTTKTAGLDPKQVKNKDKLVSKDVKGSNVRSKQGIMWDRASAFEVDPEVQRRAIKQSNFEKDLRPSLGTQKLSEFIKGKQVAYKKKFKGGGKKQDFAGLGAEVSGQKIIE